MISSNPRTEWWRPVTTAAGRAPAGGAGVPAPGGADSAVPFAALTVFLFILMLSPHSHFTSLAPLHLAFLAMAASIATHVLHRLAHHRPVIRLTREVRISVWMAGWAMLMVPLSKWPAGSASFFLEVYFKTLLLFWALIGLVNTQRRFTFVAWALSLMTVPVAVTAVMHFLSGVYVQTEGAMRIAGYKGPLTENPNDLALTLNLILPLSMALFLGAQKKVVRLALLGVICLSVIAVIITFSRAGFLALATTFCVYMRALAKRNERGWMVLAFVLLLAGVHFVTASSYIDRLSTITDIDADPTGSAQERWRDQAAAVKYTAQNPLIGAGAGMNIPALNEIRGYSWKQVHSVYLQYSVELGIPGLILFLLLFKGCLRNARGAQCLSAHEPNLTRLFYLSEGIWVSLIAFAVSAFFYPVAYRFDFYYIAGLAVAAKNICDHEIEGAVSVFGAAPAPGTRRTA